MDTVNQLLDRVKAKHAISSDYKLAQFLGLTDGAIRHYRHGRSLPDERACQKIGAALGMDGDVLAAQMLALRAKDTDLREMWVRIAQRLGGVTATVAMAVGVGSAPAPANASGTSSQAPVCILCKPNRGRRLRSALDSVMSTFGAAPAAFA